MSWLLDIKYAFRLLIKAPKFTALTLVVLIGGLSLSLFTFLFLYAIVYKPLPLPEGDTVYRVFGNHNGHRHANVAYEILQAMQQEDVFSEYGIWQDTSVRLSINDAGKTIPASFVQPNMFSFSRTEPIMGRTINQEDLRTDAEKVVVLSHTVWQNDFNQDPNIVGKNIRINETVTTVIGVMPKNYNFPIVSKLWLPLPQQLQNIQPSSKQQYPIYARLNHNISLKQAEQQLSDAANSIYQLTYKQYDKEEGELSIELASFPIAQTDRDGSIVFTFFNLIALSILILACINVGNLLLARAIERQKEIAIRAALGAPQKRLTLQLMWEGIIITLLGGVLSVLLVGALLSTTDSIIKSALPNNIPFWWNWELDAPTLLMAIVFTLLTIFLASFIPAWRSANQDINATLRDGTRGAQSKKAGKLSRMLVTFQIFLISTLLLMGSVSAFIAYFLLNVDFGVNYDRTYLASFNLPKQEYPTDQQQRNFIQGLLTELEQSPQITNTFSYFFIGQSTLKIQTEKDINTLPKKIKTFSIIGKGDFYRAELLQGRHLSISDNENAQRVVLVSQSMVERYWPDEMVLGKTIDVMLNQQEQTFTIVGVVANLADGSSFYSDKISEDEMHLSGLQFSSSYPRIIYKYHDNEQEAEEYFYQSLFKFNRNLEPSRLEPASYSSDMMKNIAVIVAWITFGSAGFALLLALTGIYGLTANSVVQRTHEIGVRRAVGATDRNIIQLFLKHGSKQLMIGMGAGMMVFSVIAIAFQSFTENMIPPLLYVALITVVVTLLSVIVMLAIYLPTRKAVKLEPSAALRYE